MNDITYKNICNILQKKMFYILLTILSLFMVSCKTIPEYSPNIDTYKLGEPGNILSKVEVRVGYLVKTAQLDHNQFVNLQVNEEEISEFDPFVYPHTLTIGIFSKIWGSGFTRRENIFYQKRISEKGKDVFEVNGYYYQIEWYGLVSDPASSTVCDIYFVTFRPIRKLRNGN